MKEKLEDTDYKKLHIHLIEIPEGKKQEEVVFEEKWLRISQNS